MQENVMNCPVCGKQPQLLWWERDRDLFPTIWHARYSCGINGHIIAAPWSDNGLGPKKDDISIIRNAVVTWNDMIRSMK